MYNCAHTSEAARAVVAALRGHARELLAQRARRALLLGARERLAARDALVLEDLAEVRARRLARQRGLARVLARESQEALVDSAVGPPAAEKASTGSAGVAPLERAESLALEAHGIALAAGDVSRAAAFVDEILEILRLGLGLG